MSQDLAFLNNISPQYLNELYAQYIDNPSSLDSGWASFFDELGDENIHLLQDIKGASWAPEFDVVQHAHTEKSEEKSKAPKVLNDNDVRSAALDSVRALMLIRAYRVRGHLEANLDPLGLWKREDHPELDPISYGFTKDDMNRTIFINGVLGLETATLKEILDRCRRIYCSTIGVEFMHMQDPEAKSWLQRRVENDDRSKIFTNEERKKILQELIESEGLETFLQTKYTGTKRFGLEGGEALIPAIEEVLKTGAQTGLEEVILGMAHRGRLNVLTNVLKKPFRNVFAEFRGQPAHPDSVQGSGDVKYHLGASTDRDVNGTAVHLSLTANPSHLEAVNPVVEGKTLSKQRLRNDEDGSKVMPILIHGDAAIAGQGVVPEVFHLAGLPGYGTGGTIHFVINNQIGFTTTPQYARSSPYPTDVGKMVQIPIFHVNGDDPENVAYISQIAAEFRAKFKSDVIVDIICYRRHGHNEGDEPKFTQPIMYEKIARHKTTCQRYYEQLFAAGTLTADEYEKMTADFRAFLEEEFKAAEEIKTAKADMLEGNAWGKIDLPNSGPRRGRTGVSLTRLKHIGRSMLTIPEGFTANSKILRQFNAKKDVIANEGDIDWAIGELLAFGSLVQDGHPVRLSGQDSGRGTFSQRHAVIYDQKTGESHTALESISEGQAMFEVLNSPLSEFAVMGFDYGYSLADPNALVCWEAQFGDFCNGAQVIIDQFIASAESKWLRMSGLVLLLPHGYEGQGPEHSSARLERFLQLCAEDNLQVVNCTTPANYFHVLRRQIKRQFRKPLIIMTPKSLLRHKLCVSPLSDLGPDKTFHRMLDERDIDYKLAKPEDMKRIILCSGKVYYDLYQKRKEMDIHDVTIVRLEQIYPFPDEALKELFEYFPNADVVWCQEEPENMGAWRFVDRRIEAVLTKSKHKASSRPVYVGRPEAASPATGTLAKHNEEQNTLVTKALSVKSSKKS